MIWTNWTLGSPDGASPKGIDFRVYRDILIVWEIVTAVLLWWGCLALSRAIRRSAMNFEAAKRIPVIALTLSLLMWLVAFISVGGEWFLMWQSHAWNGEETAFRDFTIVGIVLLVFMFPERDVLP